MVNVHHDVNLIETMTVAENVFLNAGKLNGIMLDRKHMLAETARLLDMLEVEASAKKILGTLPTDMRKMVQMARAFQQNPKALLLDESTSSLTAAEVDILIKQVKAISANGVSDGVDAPRRHQMCQCRGC